MSIILAEGVGGSNQCSQEVSLVPNDIPNRWYDHPTHIFEIIDMSGNIRILAVTLENGMIVSVWKPRYRKRCGSRTRADFHDPAQKSKK